MIKKSFKENINISKHSIPVINIKKDINAFKFTTYLWYIQKFNKIHLNFIEEE